MEENSGQPKMNDRAMFRILPWIFILLTIVLVGFFVISDKRFVIRDASGYQAVFLDNNQVYFGKLRDLGGDFASLTDIYYLRAGTVPQGGGQSAGDQVDLVKLGGELHAPSDEMIINKDHIIFYEDITAEGRIMGLIRQYNESR